MKTNNFYKKSIFTVFFIASLIKSTPGFASSLLFKSNFGPGVSLSPAYGHTANGSGHGISAWQDIKGLDSETGYSWPMTALGSHRSVLQSITYDPATPDTLDDHIHNEIQRVVGPSGKSTNILFKTVKIKPLGYGSVQSQTVLQRPWTIGDVTDLYISYWFKHKADLADQLDYSISGGNWQAQFEFKTGGYNDEYGGDYRIQTTILKGKDNVLYWMSRADSRANAPIDKIPEEDFWREDNHTVPVPVGKWFKVEIYWHRSNSDIDGRYWAAINGEVIVDHKEKNMGIANLPITRIFTDPAYSGGHPDIESRMTGLEIWNGFPCGTGVSCLGASIPPKVNIPLLNQAFTASLPGKFVFPANTFVDPDGGAMTYSAKFVDGGIEKALPAWLSFSPSTRTFSGTPPKLVKSYIIRVTATDDKAKSTSNNFILKINNAPTRNSLIPDRIWTESIPHSYTFPYATFSDVDGDALTYSAELVGGGLLPKWLSFTPSTRTLAGTPPRKAASFNIRITAKDTNELTAYDDMVIKINNKPHVAAHVVDQIWNENKLTNFTIPASFFKDIDNDALTYSATGLPAWMNFTPSTRTFSGTPPRKIASYIIKIKVQDPGGLSVTDDFKVTVNNKPIVANPLVNQSWSTGVSHSYTFPPNTFTDIDSDVLTYEIVSKPTWMSFNPTTRTLSGKPPATSGDISVRIWAKDTHWLQVFDDVLIKTP